MIVALACALTYNQLNDQYFIFNHRFVAALTRGLEDEIKSGLGINRIAEFASAVQWVQ